MAFPDVHPAPVPVHSYIPGCSLGMVSGFGMVTDGLDFAAVVCLLLDSSTTHSSSYVQSSSLACHDRCLPWQLRSGQNDRLLGKIVACCVLYMTTAAPLTVCMRPADALALRQRPAGAGQQQRLEPAQDGHRVHQLRRGLLGQWRGKAPGGELAADGVLRYGHPHREFTLVAVCA